MRLRERFSVAMLLHSAKPSEMIRACVVNARSVQLRRFHDEKIRSNAQMDLRHLHRYRVLPSECEKIRQYVSIRSEHG